MRLIRLLLLCALCGVTTFCTYGQQLSGTIIDADTGETLPTVNVYVAGTALGTTADFNGFFELSLPQASAVTFSLIGYESVQLFFNAQRDTSVTVQLREAALDLQTAFIVGKKENVGKSIMKKVIAQKIAVLGNATNYSFDSYLRTEMEKWSKKKERDTSDVQEGWQTAYWKENLARQHFYEKKHKRIVKAELKQTVDDALKRFGATGVGLDFEGTGTTTTYNPIEYLRRPEDVLIDLYANTINNSSLTDRPIISPLSSSAAFANYKFKLVDIEVDDGDSLYVIDVRPRFRQAPLFDGRLKIKKDGHLLHKATLTLPDGVLNSGQNFELEMTYALVQEKYWRPISRRFYYEVRYSGNRYQVETLSTDSQFEFAPIREKGFFNNEVMVYETTALTPDTVLLQRMRPVQLTAQQQQFQSEQDSIWRYRQSPEYYRVQDSIYNRNSVLDVLFDGIGWKRRSKGIRLYFNSVLENARILGVGGYRQAFGGSVTKEFTSNNELEVEYDINYGFNNKDWKGELDVSYTYWPQKFARFYGGFGDDYEFITINRPLQAILSNSNFIRSQRFSFGHSFEVRNGIYLTTDFEYADKRPITDLMLSDWSDDAFGELNAPVEFERYRGLFMNVELTFKFHQKYITRGRKKIVLGTRYPTLKVKYRKGIPDIGQSEVDFDHLEIRLSQNSLPRRLGTTNWKIKAGSFFNVRNLRSLEYRFFRGSDEFLFIDPLNNLQALGPTLSTPNPYLMSGIIHHFNGLLLDKIPLLNQLQMEIITGFSFWTIPTQKFAHGEAYAGLGKNFRLFGETVQVALYAVTADSNLDKAAIRYKIGFNLYNAFSQTWAY
ncbi:MAG: DUF5686 and carboxypeptidase regulatory-like domain-containing protein [Bacteroidota bacterium]